MLKRYIGDRSFYKRVLAIAIPIVIQNGITNFVSLLDNIMVGQIGTLQMSGVSIVNNLVFVFNLCIFGGASGAGIYVSQFFGQQNHQGIRHAFRYKLLFCLLISILGIGVFLLGGDALINSYLLGEGDPAEAAMTLDFARRYLSVMLWGLVPFALSNAYAGTLRECGQTVLPMVAGVVAVFVNLFFNYVLIFGHFGAPAMGVTGAALATVISRYVELLIVVIWTHLHSKKNPFVKGLYRGFHIPGRLAWGMTLRSLPMLLNEALWSSGEATLNQIFSTRGLDVMPALNICGTIFNIGNVAVIAMGCTVGIIMGQLQGAGNPPEKLWDANRKLTAFSLAIGVVFCGLLSAVSGIFPLLYNTTEAIRHTASNMILISALYLPILACIQPIYFTVRSGGKTGITFLFDSGFSWGVMVPVVAILCHFTSIPILPLFFVGRVVGIGKCIIGSFILKKGTWIQNLTT